MKVKGIFLLLGTAALFLAGVLPGAAQTVTGTMGGHVADSSGGMMPNVKVVAKNEQTQGVREATTNNDGYYLISFLPIGSYTVTVAGQGFRTVEKKGVGIELNKTTVSDFTLEPAGVAATVEVKGGEIPLIDTSSGELVHSLDAQTIENTPLPGRNFISLVEQIPGYQNASTLNSAANNPTNSTGSYATFSGGGSRSTTFQIDGVNNDDSSENQNRQNVNPSSIKEFQVLTNSFAAEFGRAGGAVVLVQTKSGTNSFHGDLYDFIQNDIFNANDYFANRSGSIRPPVRRNQYGGTLGGPIWRDHLFFFSSGERLSSVGKGSISRFIWLPTDQTGQTLPRACGPGEVAKPGNSTNPLGIYCVDSSTHPNLQRDLTFLKSIMNLWNTPELQGKTPNDPLACRDLIASGRANRCVLVSGLGFNFPDSDYSGKMDWLTDKNTTMAVRYQYSRQIRTSPRIILGDNFGSINNRQYNIGYTLTHVYNPRQTGEFRYGFGNRATLQEVTDGDTIPIIRFAFPTTLVSPALSSDTVPFGGTVIGTSTNVPINRHQRDQQFVYNHSMVFNRHTFRMGVDQRFQSLDDLASNAQRGFWTFGTLDSLDSLRNGTGFTSWENFLRGIFGGSVPAPSGYQEGFGPTLAEFRFRETNLYAQDDLRLRRNLTFNLGVRWEGVTAPKEIRNRFSYGYKGDFDNVEPRIGFAWSPEAKESFLSRLTGGPGNFVIRGGYGIFHGRVFQSIFSQSGLSFRFQPPNGFFYVFNSSNCPTNPSNPFSEVSGPLCGFQFTPGQAIISQPQKACGTDGFCVQEKGGQLQSTLLLPDPKFHLPYVQQWNLTVERKLPGRMAVQLGYMGNRGIGLPFFNQINRAQFPITSPIASVDVGGGNFQPIVFDRFCQDFSDSICVTLKSGNVDPSKSGALKEFSSLLATNATLAQKGIVIVSGVPHGYISVGSTVSGRFSERRPDPRFIGNITLSNFAWTYYNAMVLKFTKVTSHGLSFTGSWTFSKTMDTGSEATFTNPDVNDSPGLNNPAKALRALSSYDTRHRVVLTYSYEFPWLKSQQGVLGRIIGGWVWSGVTTFQSGNPFTVFAGYDVNLDGLGGDRPRISNPSILYTSVDAGRQSPSCAPGGVCADTASQAQLPGTAFIPSQANLGSGDQFALTPGQDGTGTIGRNTFFGQGLKNFDTSLMKFIHIRERVQLELRMELYNAFNRVNFSFPTQTVNSLIPLGRITSTRNPSNFVNSGRTVGSRMGQLAIRVVF